MTEIIQETLNRIQAIDLRDLKIAQERLDSLTKPPGSLGRLEEFARRYAAIKGVDSPTVRRKAVFVFAADHGIAEEGVSAYPAEVTPQMVLNFLNGGAAINVLARHVGAEVQVVDMGVNFDFAGCPNLIHKKIAPGTRNMSREPAMTRRQAEEALQAGIELAMQWAEQETDIFATGDMGIGNSTSAAAIMSVHAKKTPRQVTGRGTGIDDAALEKKIALIERTIQINRPNPEDPLDVLAKIGGFEIAAIAGFILGAAASRTPIVIDGLISGAAAVSACKMNPAVRDYIFPSHKSQEPGHDVFFQILQCTPLFDFGMRLGEGTGAVLAMGILESSVRIYNEMATFAEAQVASHNIQADDEEYLPG